jgi:hypothetical protein
MADPAKEWPSYHIGTRDHLHALGVLVANWNNIETAYQAFIQLIFPQHMQGGIRVFQLMNNDQRIKLIKEELMPSLGLLEADGLDHFLKMAHICYANRNALAHAHAHHNAFEEKFRISQGGKNNVGAQYLFKLNDLREMADAAHATFMFGLSVWGYIQIKSTFIQMTKAGQDTSWLPLRSLPEKPSLPRSWDQIREIPTPRPPPPESSSG